VGVCPEPLRAGLNRSDGELGAVQRALNDLEATKESLSEALAIYCTLAQQRPDVYRPDVAMTLNNLGAVQHDLNDLEAARESFIEALAIRRTLAQQRPDVFRPDVALTLNNLGKVQCDLNDLEAARESFIEALAIRRTLAVRRIVSRTYTERRNLLGHSVFCRSWVHLYRLLDKVTKHDVVLIGLAGHGLQYQVKVDGKERDESFFCPSDALT
jgi:tetratricopeptide (TPR) repeat protein